IKVRGEAKASGKFNILKKITHPYLDQSIKRLLKINRTSTRKWLITINQNRIVQLSDQVIGRKPQVIGKQTRGLQYARLFCLLLQEHILPDNEIAIRRHISKFRLKKVLRFQGSIRSSLLIVHRHSIFHTVPVLFIQPER